MTGNRMKERKTTYSRSRVQILRDSMHDLLPGVPGEEGSVDPKISIIPTNSPKPEESRALSLQV